MASIVAQPEPTFADNMYALLEKTTYTTVSSEEELIEVGRLRYDAYLRESFIKAETYPDGIFLDAYDHKGHVTNVKIMIDGELASCIRIHLMTCLADPGPTRMAFTDIVDPYLAGGHSVIDPGRLAVNYHFARQYAQLPFITLRVLHMAQRHFDADYCMPAMQLPHQAFYKRYLMYETLSLPRTYPNVTRPVGMMIGAKEKLDLVVQKHPYFDSTPEERLQIFGPPSIKAI